MTSSGKLSSATVDFVAPLRLWHGLRPPPMVGFVERESGGPASRSALRAFERAVTSSGELQEGRESEHANAPRLFNCPVWTSPKAAGPIRASVRGGAPPARLVFCKAFSMEKRITFDPCIKLLSSLHIYNITTFVIVLIYEILQPFIKV